MDAFKAHLLIAFEFVLNPVVPPGVFVSLLVVVSMTLSASILPNLFSSLN